MPYGRMMKSNIIPICLGVWLIGCGGTVYKDPHQYRFAKQPIARVDGLEIQVRSVIMQEWLVRNSARGRSTGRASYHRAIYLRIRVRSKRARTINGSDFNIASRPRNKKRLSLGPSYLERDLGTKGRANALPANRWHNVVVKTLAADTPRHRDHLVLEYKNHVIRLPHPLGSSRICGSDQRWQDSRGCR